MPIEQVVLCGPGSAVPGLAEQMQSVIGLPFAIGRPHALAGYDDAPPPASPSPTASPWRAEMRPVNLIPPDERRGERTALRGGPPPTSSSAPWSPPSPGSP